MKHKKWKGEVGKVIQKGINDGVYKVTPEMAALEITAEMVGAEAIGKNPMLVKDMFPIAD
jgi:hypothetical protein